jgi:hypothetical protein
MSEEKNIEEQRQTPISDAPSKAPSETRSWLSRNRDPIIVISAITAIMGGMGFLLSDFDRTIREAMKASHMESAYTDVVLQKVAVNGYRGTPEWRGFYKLGLERFLGQHDFSDLCMPNGFLKDSYVAGALPCIAIGDKRAVRAYNDTVSYFKEDSWRRMTHPLDIMEQDIHSDGYLDIDAFSKAVEDRASKQVADAAAAAKAADDAVSQNTRIFKEALQLVVPLYPDHVTRLPDAK